MKLFYFSSTRNYWSSNRIHRVYLCAVLMMTALFDCADSFGQTNQSDSLISRIGMSNINGGGTVDYYTGQSGFSIPLFDIKTKGFNIPVALYYNSAGFKPNSPSGIYGLNWQLSAESAITRKINVAPDETSGNCQSNSGTGYYRGVKDNSSSIDNQIFYFTAPFAQSCFGDWYYYTSGGYEYAPDEFSFNCLGHSGKFYLNYGGNVRVVSNEDIKVDLTNFSLQDPTINPVASTIVLTTSDGYKFTFGGDLKNLEYVYELGDYGPFGGTITKWHLVKVTSPDNNEIIYTYKDYTPDITESGIINSFQEHYVLNFYPNRTSEIKIQSSVGGQLYVLSEVLEADRDVNRLTKVAYLAKIHSQDFSLIFTYTTKIKKSYPDNFGNFSYYDFKGFQLTEILFNNSDGTQIKKLDFNYQDIGGANYTRNFLTSLKESGKGTYNFYYYRTAEIPVATTRDIDHWGFWKGGNGANNILPALSQDVNGDQIISSGTRDPDGSYFNVALLERVKYPQGGITTFVYEPHDYAKRLERRSANSFLPALYVSSNIAGGARIKSITDSAVNGLTMKRAFQYKTDYLSNGTTSSGVLLEWPRYIQQFSSTSESTTYTTTKKRASGFFKNYNIDEHYINYSEVTETMTNNGYKVFKFNNFETNPDYADYNSHDFNALSAEVIDFPDLQHGFRLNDRSIERGKIKFAGAYDQNKVLVKSTTTSYAPFNPYIPAIVSTTLNSNMQAYKIYLRPYRVNSVTSFVSGAPSLSTTKNYIYDANWHNIIRESTTLSNGKTLQRAITYATDYAAGTPFTDNMKTAGLTGLPIEDVTYLSDASNTHVLSGKIIKYTADGKGRPEFIYNLENTAPIPLANFKFSCTNTNYFPGLGPATTFSEDSRYKQSTQFKNYDSFGNPREYTALVNKGAPGSLIWGYNGQYTTASINNAKLNDVYFQNFEENMTDYEFNLNRVGIKTHTGLFSGLLQNSGTSEVSSHSSIYMPITSGASRMFTYSGWVYSTGPSVELLLFMYRNGETGYFSYVDAVSTATTGKWVFLKKNFLVPADVTRMRLRLDVNSAGSAYFDDLCFRPAESALKTYTYEPFTGLTSSTDVNGNTLLYEYDQYKRLINIKRDDGSIVKNYSYNFINP